MSIVPTANIAVSLVRSMAKSFQEQQSAHDDKLATALAAVILINTGFSYRLTAKLLGVSHEWVRTQVTVWNKVGF